MSLPGRNKYKGCKSFSVRLMVMILCVSVLPILVLQMLSYTTMNKVLTDNTQMECENRAKADGESIRLMTERYQIVAEEISTNTTILTNIGYLNLWDSKNYRIAGTRIRTELYNAISAYEDILGACIVTKNGEMLFQDKVSHSSVYGFVVPTENQRYRPIFQRTMETHEFLYNATELREEEDYGSYRIMVMSQSIPNYTGASNQNIAMLILYINEVSVAQMLDARNGDGQTVTFLTDANGLVLASSQQDAIGQTLNENSNGTVGMKDALRLAAKDLKYSSKLASACYTLDGGRLKIYSVMQESGSAEMNRQSTMITLALALVLIAISVMAVWGYSLHLGRDVDSILDTMDKANQGDLKVRSGVARKDEFGAISNHLNAMLEKIQLLLRRTEEAKDKQRIAEIQALEAQINPHFMFNTLDSINWMAVENGQFEISQMLKYLGDLFRYSVRSSEIIEIKTEISHLRQYVYLQQRRYAYGFVCRIKVEKEVETCHIHKLLLQPLVENALLHGFDFSDTEEKENRISVEVFLEKPGRLVLQVCDNGKGMDMEMIRELNEELPSDVQPGKCIGVRNVISRIQMYYGPDGWVSFEKAEPTGLTVSIHIPVEEGQGI